MAIGGLNAIQVARSVSKGISGNRLQDGDKQSKSEFSFLTSPCDFVEDLSEDSSQESKGFELEFEIPVVSAPVVQPISVKSKLFDPFSIGNLLVRRILYYLSSEMATKSLLFPRRRLAVSRTMPQPLKKLSRFC